MLFIWNCLYWSSAHRGASFDSSRIKSSGSVKLMKDLFLLRFLGQIEVRDRRKLKGPLLYHFATQQTSFLVEVIATQSQLTSSPCKGMCLSYKPPQFDLVATPDGLLHPFPWWKTVMLPMTNEDLACFSSDIGMYSHWKRRLRSLFTGKVVVQPRSPTSGTDLRVSPSREHATSVDHDVSTLDHGRL